MIKQQGLKHMGLTQLMILRRIIRYKDRKRLLWLNSTLMPIYPLAGIGAFMLTGTQWYLLIPLIINYIIIPILEAYR